jgi:hypothetical protein
MINRDREINPIPSEVKFLNEQNLSQETLCPTASQKEIKVRNWGGWNESYISSELTI